MSITRSIFKNLYEAESVKKTYGDKPQEGKTEKLQRGKTASIPKGKAEGKFKVEKLQNVNKEAGEIYANDTDKLMDKIDSKEQSDKGKVAKTTGTKADRTIKYPFGDKVDTPSDNKLIKESCNRKERLNQLKESGLKKNLTEGYSDREYALLDLASEMKRGYPSKDTIKSIESEYDTKLTKSDIETAIEYALENYVYEDEYDSEEEYNKVVDSLENKKPLKECDGAECDKKSLKESDFDEYSDPVEVLEAIYTQYEGMNMTGEFFNDLLNHTDLSLEDLISWYEMGEGECAKPVKECAGKECK